MATPVSSPSPPTPPTPAVIITLRLCVPESRDDRSSLRSHRHPVRDLPPVSQLQRYLDLSG